ncbi:MAG: hypothetical protein HKP62_03060 [Sulfurovum sp.]|nr:phage protease [Sulfurovum sp.]NNJ44976.1 hypothetical protein [Sulfurovum sp.]
MIQEIKTKLEEIVVLLNDPEETVMEKELKDKLEKIVALLNNPEDIATEQETKEKLEAIVALVNNVMVDPDIDIEYCIPDVATTTDSCDVSGDPYILVTYVVSEYTKPTRKIRLTDSYLRNTAKAIANLVTFSIEQFKTEIDSVEMG